MRPGSSAVTDPCTRYGRFRPLPQSCRCLRLPKAGLTILTRDSKILQRVAEVNAVVAAQARMFVITGPAHMDLWQQLRVVAAQWPRMLERRQAPGPFIDSITLTATRRLVPDRVL